MSAADSLETQVRAALDQLAAPIEHGAECEPGPLWRCTCDYEERLLAAWSQATARAAHKLARAFAVENVTEFGFGVPEEINRVTASIEYEFVAALSLGEAPTPEELGTSGPTLNRPMIRCAACGGVFIGGIHDCAVSPEETTE